MSDTPNPLRDALLLELGATALQGILFPFGVAPRAVSALGPGKTRPVVLIHGYNANRASLLVLEGYLRAVGFDRLFPVNLGEVTGVEPLAERLAGFVSEVRAACGGQDSVDLVASSLGGLVARFYLQELGGAREVDQCITLGTPHYGTYSSFWAPTPVGRQMRPDSEFIRRLNAPGCRAPGVRFHSLWAERDLMILPRENAIYREGADTRVEGAGHIGILVHPHALRTVECRLRAGQVVPQTGLQRAMKLGRRLWEQGTGVVESLKRR